MGKMSLSNIQTGTISDPPRIVIYGPGGIGKTTFGSTAPAPVLIATEKGKGKLSIPSFPLVESWEDCVEAMNELITQEHAFKTVVIDSLDWMEPHIWKKTCLDHDKGNIEDFGYGKGYVHALSSWSFFLKGLNYLQERHGMTVILTAHAEVKRFDSPEVEPYDRYQIKLHKQAAAMIEEWADIILFANWEVHTTKTEVGFKKAVTRGIGSGRRMIYTEERPAFKAKNRYGLPPKVELTNPFDWAGFLNHIGCGIPMTDNEVLPETTTNDANAQPEGEKSC